MALIEYEKSDLSVYFGGIYRMIFCRMKLVISIAVVALLFWGSANAATDFPEINPISHSYRMSGDGSEIFYISEGPNGPALWRRGGTRDGISEIVTEWLPETVRYATARSGDAVLVMKMSEGMSGLDLVLWMHSDMGWTSKQLMTAAPVAAFESSTDEFFHVLVQLGDDQFKRYSFDSSGKTVSTEDYSLPAMDVIYAANGIPRLFLDARENSPLWREVSNQGVGEAVSIPDSVVVQQYLFASTNEPIVFALARVADNDTLQAVGVNWKTGQITSYFSQIGLDIDSVIRSPDGNTIDGVRYERDKPHNQPVNDSLAQDSIFLESYFGLEPQIIGRSFDDRTWLLRVERPDRPMEYWLHDHELKTHFRVDPVVEGNDSGIVPPSAYATLVTKDGFEIPYYLAAPQKKACDVSQKSCPLAVLIHGGPSRRDRIAYQADTAWLQSRGFWVVRINFRGSSGYGLGFRLSGDRQWGAAMIDDVNAVVGTVSADPRIDKRRISAIGSSYGGFAAIASGARAPDIYRCVISINGGGDLVQMARSGKRREPELARGIAIQVGDPDVPSDLEAIRLQSPAEHAATFKPHVMQVVSMLDAVTDPGQSLNFDAALRSAGKNPGLIKLEHADHNLSGDEDRARAYKGIDRFLRRRCQ